MILHGDPEPSHDAGDGKSRFALLDPRHPARCLLDCLTRTTRICGCADAEHCVVDGDGDWSEITRGLFDDALRAEADRTAERLLLTESP